MGRDGLCSLACQESNSLHPNEHICCEIVFLQVSRLMGIFLLAMAVGALGVPP